MPMCVLSDVPACVCVFVACQLAKISHLTPRLKFTNHDRRRRLEQQQPSKQQKQQQIRKQQAAQLAATVG